MCFKLRLGQEHLNLGGNYALNFYCIALIEFLFCVCIGKYRYSWVYLWRKSITKPCVIMCKDESYLN